MNVRLISATALALVIGSPVAAHSVDFSNPYGGETHHGLRFADLEFGMPTDPLLWSADPGWEPHHTPLRLLADANDQLSRSVPIGTNVEDAVAVLRKAGARCGRASSAGVSGAYLTCAFRDVEFPYGGDYTDNVTWKVTMPLQDGRVSGLNVTRDWTRR